MNAATSFGRKGEAPTVSVALGTFNGERFLEQQLASLAAQTHLPAELVACDDGSSDATVEMLRRFAAGAPFPVHIHQNPSRVGFRDNFIAAAMRCASRYVAFCDQDDVWSPLKLERSVEALERAGALACTHSVRLIDADSADLGVEAQGVQNTCDHPPLTLPPWGIFRGFTLTFPRALLDLAPLEARPEDHHIADAVVAHDQWVYFLAASLGVVVQLAEPLADYRQHGANVFGVDGKTDARTVADRFRARRDTLVRYARSCSQRAAIMAEVSARREGDLAAKAVRARDYWSDLHSAYAQSTEIYLEPRFARRVELLWRLIRRGAYSAQSDEGLGRNGLASDVMALFVSPRPAVPA